jgi:glycosidase
MSNRQIIMHTFLWKIKDITKNLDKIKESGFTAIQTNVIQPCKEGDEWWTYYQPTHFKVGNKCGSREDLIELCREAKKRDIKVIVDVVLRHCAGNNRGELIPHEAVDEELKNNPDFWTNAENTTDYQSREHAISKAFGMPMLNYDSPLLQQRFIDFLQDLKDCNVSGFRIDMGKHFALKEEGSDFWENVFGRFSDMFNYAECLECSKELLDKYTKFINVLTDSSASDRSKMVVFIMTHDTEETWGFTKNMNDRTIINEWRYLLQSNRESHVLWYCRAWSDLWQSDEIKWINREFR